MRFAVHLAVAMPIIAGFGLACVQHADLHPQEFAPNSPTKIVVQVAGGSVQSADGLLTLDFPENAVDGPKTITITAVEEEHLGALSRIYQLGPTGLSFAKPVQISLSIEGAKPAGHPVIANMDGTKPIAVETSAYLAKDMLLVGNLRHFSNYGAFDFDDDECADDPRCAAVLGCDGSNCPCNFLLQDCAVPGQRCFPDGPTAQDGQCYPAGGRALGEPCVEPPVDTPTACGAGLLCIYENEESLEGICHEFCETRSDCPENHSCRAISLDDGPSQNWGLCAADAPPPPPPPPPTCDVFAQDCVDSDEMCVLQDRGQNLCVSPGSGTQGAPCSTATDCSSGLQCAAVTGYLPASPTYTIDDGYMARGGGSCAALCTPGDDSTCGAADDWECAPIVTAGFIRTDAGVCTNFAIRQEGEPCAEHTDCGGALACIDDICSRYPEGWECGVDDDCAEGLQCWDTSYACEEFGGCSHGICRAPGNGGQGDPCTDDFDCGDDLWCIELVCDVPEARQ